MYLLHIDFSLVHTQHIWNTKMDEATMYTELQLGPPFLSLGEDKF